MEVLQTETPVHIGTVERAGTAYIDDDKRVVELKTDQGKFLFEVPGEFEWEAVSSAASWAASDH